MKNYLKFVIVVFAITVALFSSISADAQGKLPGTCTLTMDVCGTTPGGNVIDGKYNK